MRWTRDALIDHKQCIGNGEVYYPETYIKSPNTSATINVCEKLKHQHETKSLHNDNGESVRYILDASCGKMRGSVQKMVYICLYEKNAFDRVLESKKRTEITC